MEEKNYLANNGYKVGRFLPMRKNASVECWVKANKVESLGHTFLVQNIRMELLKLGGEVEVAITFGPDLIYTSPKGERLVIEVETGIKFKYRKKSILKKFSDLYEKYDCKTVIILTDAGKSVSYERLLGDMFPIFNRKTFKKYIDDME